MRTITTLFILTISMMGFAQSSSQDKIQAAKIALITERLNLTPEQAQKFWPIYNEYTKKQEDVRKAFTEAKRNHDPETATDQETQRLLEIGMEAKQQALSIEKQYTDRFLEVINNRQLLNLRTAEKDFIEMMRNRLRQQQQNRQQLRERIQDQRNNQRRRNN